MPAPKKERKPRKPVSYDAAILASDNARENMHILELRVENIKRVKVAHIKPKGNVVVVAGKNGQGKSSVLDAISWGLTGTSTISRYPIRKGNRTGSVKIDIGDFIVTRYFTHIDEELSQKGLTYISKLVITGKRGETYQETPQTLLDRLMGKISFDPMEFLRMKDDEQIETLRGLTKFDIDIDALDAEDQQDYERRREANREVESLKSRLNVMEKPADELPRSPIDISELTKQLQDAANHNSIVAAQRQKKTAFEEDVERYTKEAAELRGRAAELLDEARALDGFLGEIKLDREPSGLGRIQMLNEKIRSMEISAEIDTVAVAAELNQATATNAAIQSANAYYAVQSELRNAEAKWHEIDVRMTERDKQRAESIARASMPIEGLSLGRAREHYGSIQQEILYNGLPLAQASYAEQIKVSMALGMASNPKLRVLRISDGSLLDDDSLAVIGELAEEHNFQVWIERVETSGKVSVVMEDGTASGEDVEVETEKKEGDDAEHQ